VLLDSSLPDRENRFSYLFLDPEELLCAESVDGVKQILEGLDRETVREGLWAAGWLAYEAGYGLENPLNAPAMGTAGSPLLWFGLYRQPYIFDHHTGRWLGNSPQVSSDPSGYGEWNISGLELDAGERQFSVDVERIKELIAAGRTYQVNYTRRWNFSFDGEPLALYRHLRTAQPVPYAALIDSGATQVLSFSPELFFRTDSDGRIVTRPMKGTISRGLDSSHDRRQVATLRHDSKNRAENLMIVDLLRNDLGRICRTGSVQVPRLFDVERYRSLLQMTSTVEGTLLPDAGIARILNALFPSGSVTGAPKISTMDIIAGLEDSPRGVYTGAVGFAAPDGTSCFNVAIRTLELRGGQGVMGAGCGIVADSRGNEEYAECRLKARFLTGSVSDEFGNEFKLIETMLADHGRIELLDLHLDRLRDSSHYFGRPFSRGVVNQVIAESMADNLDRLKVRLLLDSRGGCSVECSPVASLAGPVRIAFWQEKIDSSDLFFRHKTTKRKLYNRARGQAAKEGLLDYVFVNKAGYVTEGSITNIYVEEEGILYTPPLRCGVLPGVYRRMMKRRGKPPVRDRQMTADDFCSADRLWISNAVIGLVEAVLVE
jgi:para-aminobenzoate synthetase/4-amino-4-deoxychorismate lyase